MARLIILLWLITATGAAASLNWQRMVSSWGPVRYDEPATHPLSYFRVEPRTRRLQEDRVALCGATYQASQPEEKINTSLRLVGKVMGFAIFDLVYTQLWGDVAAVRAKSILIQTGPDEFHEIYFGEAPTSMAGFDPTVITRAGRKWLLVSGSQDGGNAGGTFLAVFLLRGDGPIHLNFEALSTAATKVLPLGKNLWFRL